MGRTMLICEDEPLLMMMVEEIIQDFGFSPLTPSGYEECLEAAKTADIQGALVDMNLWNEKAGRIIDELKSRNIPYVIMSGYSAEEISEAFEDAHIITKPFDMNTVEMVFGRAFPPAVGPKVI